MAALEQVQTARMHGMRSLSLDGSFVQLEIRNGKVFKTRAATMILDREKVVIDFLNKVLKRNAEAWKVPIPLQGTISIGLHDTYDANEVYDVLVFSKKADARGQILIPDMYAMNHYGGMLGSKDTRSFENKKDRATFIGCTTGSTNPTENARLRLCQWAHDHPGVADCFISRIVQMRPADVYGAFPAAYSYVLDRTTSVSVQREYKYLINMDGNTCAWDRLPWILASQSVALKERTDTVNWYYGFLEDTEHFMGFDTFDEIPQIMKELSLEDAKRIIANANAFVQTFLNLEAHMFYMACVLHYYLMPAATSVPVQPT